MTAQTDNEIVATLKENYEKGFRLLMANYKEAIYWHIRRLVVVHEDAQDAAQETFVRVFRSIDKFKGDSSLSTWIYRIATNEALRIIGKRKGFQVSISDCDAEAKTIKADEYVDYTDVEAIKLQKAILSLPTKQQLAFNLRYYDELGYKEIAEITGSTEANMKANYHLAKEKIIKYINSMT